MCVTTSAAVKKTKKPDLRGTARRMSEGGKGPEGRGDVQDDDGDVLAVDGVAGPGGGAYVEADEGGERPRAEEHGPEAEYEEKLGCGSNWGARGNGK